MARALFSLLILVLTITFPAFAYDYQWVGGECIATNNAGFSQPNNWFPLDPMSPPTPTSGNGDTLIFDGPSGVGIGSCTNVPFDDIHSNILGQRPEWGGLFIGQNFVINMFC